MEMFQIGLGPLKHCCSAPLLPPSVDIRSHLLGPVLYLRYLLADLANIAFVLRSPDESKPACFSSPVFFRALLSELAPVPESACPTSLLEEAHD